MTKLAYPEDCDPKNMFNPGFLILADEEIMKTSIVRAAEYMAARPEFEPKFARCANVICCADDADKEFVETCTEGLWEGPGEFKFDMVVFVFSVLFIREEGWGRYLDEIRNVSKETAE